MPENGVLVGKFLENEENVNAPMLQQVKNNQKYYSVFAHCRKSTLHKINEKVFIRAPFVL